MAQAAVLTQGLDPRGIRGSTERLMPRARMAGPLARLPGAAKMAAQPIRRRGAPGEACYDANGAT